MSTATRRRRRDAEHRAEGRGHEAILIVDLMKEIGPSSSGKNTLIASTAGNANVPGFEGVKVGLNVYKAKKP
jgi:hypothetical protein